MPGARREPVDSRKCRISSLVIDPSSRSPKASKKNTKNPRVALAGAGSAVDGLVLPESCKCLGDLHVFPSLVIRSSRQASSPAFNWLSLILRYPE